MTDKYTMTDVAMPQLAESLVSATIAKWLKKPGDPIEQYEPICEVITDKVNAEIPSTLDGVMGDILAEEGQVVSVGEVICRIQTAGASDGTVASAGGASEPAHSPGAAISGDTSMRSRYSPAVQTLAAQHGIDLNRVQGTGLGGRITRKDVLKYIEQGGSQGAAAQPAVTEPARAERRELSG